MFVSRAGWGALRPKSIIPRKGPASQIFLTSTNTTTCGEDEIQCIEFIRNMQLHQIRGRVF